MCLKWYIRWDVAHWYLQDVSSKRRRMHLLLKWTWNILQDRPHLGHKSGLSKFQNTELLSSIFSDHNTMKLDISYKKNIVRNTNICRLKNTCLNKKLVTEDIKREVKMSLKQVTMKIKHLITYGIHQKHL